MHKCILLRASLCPVCEQNTRILTERLDKSFKICKSALTLVSIFRQALFEVFLAGHGLRKILTEFSKTAVCIANREKVKTVPYLFHLFTSRHFSLTSALSKSVGYAFITQPHAFLQTSVIEP